MRVCVTLALLVSVALRPAAAGQAPADPSRAGAPRASTDRVLIYGGNDSFPPYEFLDANRQPAGFNVALIRALAEEAHVPVTVSLGRWRERMEALERGQIDLVSMAVTDERLRRFGLLVQTWTLQQSVLFAQGRGTTRAIWTSLAPRRSRSSRAPRWTTCCASCRRFGDPC